MEAKTLPQMLVVGRIIGVHGVRGWVKIFSETEPRQNILTYSPWYLGLARQAREVAEGRPQGKGMVARVKGCDDRDQATALVGEELAVSRDQLPPPSADEYYWVDLEGLAVETKEGVALGRVDHLFATPANDVLVVKGERERLIPFLWDAVIKEVNFDRGLIQVEWDIDF
mgnify:FL=1